MSSPQQKDRRRLRWLCAGFVSYFFLMLYCARYARTLPHQAVVVAAALNMAAILAFVFNIKKVYLSAKHPRSIIPEDVTSTATLSQSSAKAGDLRLKVLWIGAALYSVAFIKGVAYGVANAGRAPLLILVLAETLNGAILAAFFVAIAEVYRKRKNGGRVAR